MSRPRRYWPVLTIRPDGAPRWSIEAECWAPECAGFQSGEHQFEVPGIGRVRFFATDCGHRVPIAGLYLSRERAIDQINRWHQLHAVLMAEWGDNYHGTALSMLCEGLGAPPAVLHDRIYMQADQTLGPA